jgi:hypothetical protein
MNRAGTLWVLARIALVFLAATRANGAPLSLNESWGPLEGAWLFHLPIDRMCAMTTLPQSERTLAERFAVPPADSRILKIIHMLPDNPGDQDMLIRSLTAQGFGGMATNVSFENYLESEPNWAAFTRAVTEAKKAGMALWLYDERGYPSGNAGGITMRDHPEWEACGLLIADTASEGGTVTLQLPPGDLMRAAAFPVSGGIIDLNATTDLSESVENGTLHWEAPPRSCYVMVITKNRLYEGTHAAVSLADKLPYVNLLMPEPTARFLEVTHAQYANRLGNDLGKWFTATFTDEPSLMSLFMRPQPYRVLPWAPNLAAEFHKRRGYELEPLIPALVADAGPKGQSVRYDFWLTVGELVSENFFGQIQQWCREHNILSGGHLLLEEPLLTHVPLYGDFFRCARRLDAPSIDCLTSIPEEVPWFIARLISSVADLEGRAVTMCETSDHVQRFRPPGDDRPVREVTEDEIRGTCNRLIVNGITTITSYYSFSGLSTSQLLRLNEWVGRCCTMLKGGHQVTDIALLYPVESVWPQFSPARNWTEDAPAAAHQIERVYHAAAKDLYSSGRDFTYVDAKTLAEADVQDGVLRHGRLQWRVVVLPCADTLPLRAWENLALFYRTGGALIALTALPANSESEFPSQRVQALSHEMFGQPDDACVTANSVGGAGVFLPRGSEALLPLVLDSLLERDIRVADKDAPVRGTHRRIDGCEVYFLINDSGKAWEGQVAFVADGPGEQWDPDTGRATPLDSPEGVDLRLDVYGGTLFRFERSRQPQRLAVPGGRLSAFSPSPLPEVQPSMIKGEFVTGELTPEPERSSRLTSPGWLAQGTLTKGQVDTFLFLAFDYPDTIDISDVNCLTVETWTPQDQRVSTPLRVILRDTNGVEYLANTERPLSAAGRELCFVRLTRFARAGWNTTPCEELDFSSIASIRVGWGGYYGKEGEQVEFALSAPKVVRLQEP